MLATKQYGFLHRRGAVLLIGLGLAAVPCLAQTDAPQGPPPDAAGQGQGYGGPHRGGPEHRAEMLQHELSLSADQFTQVKAVLEAERSQMEALHTNTSLSREDMHAQMMSIHQGTDTKIRALLTADQVTEYDAMEARMRARRQEHEDGQAPPPLPPASAPQP